MRLRALLETGSLGLRLLTGEDELDRTVRGVMTTDLRDPGRYLSGDELVLTGLAWRRSPQDSEPFVRILAAEGVAGLAAGEAELGLVPDDLVEACAKHRMPLFAVTEDVAFATVTEHVLRQVSTERAGDLAAVVDRHRRMMAPGPGGGGPDAVLELLGTDLDLRAWVLSVTGRAVAAGGTAAAGHAPLPHEVRARLAGEHLAAARSGRPGHRRVEAGGTVYSLFPVRSGPESQGGAEDAYGRRHLPYGLPHPHDTPDRGEAALGEWFLAVEDDAGEWPAERLDLVEGVTQLVAVERERRDADRPVRRRLATEVLELLQAGAPPAEISARLRVAAPVLLPGVGSAPHWQVVVARLEEPGSERDAPDGMRGAGASPGGARHGPPAPADGTAHRIAHGARCRALLEEILLDPRAAGAEDAETAGRVAVTHLGGEAIALVPLPAPHAADSPASGDAVPPGSAAPSSDAKPLGAPAGSPAAGTPPARAAGPAAGRGLSAAALLAAVRDPLERGLAGGGRLTLGVSAVVSGAGGLHGAVEEARHARRVAAAREGRVCAAGHEELASHVLLLPFVPDDVRRAFTARLLAPLHEYDRRHRAELLPTLAAFLSADGSWTRCAARLHLHVNTLRYRIGRIEQLTGRDLSRLEDKLDFFLALRLN